MHDAELIIGLLLAVAVLAGFAHAVGVEYPIVLVVGGLAMALIPGAPRIRLDPHLVFLAFLPPLVYSAAFLSSPGELRKHARHISLLAVALVLVTTLGVAAVAHLAIGVSWGAAFVLGAVVAPTDPIAATSVLRRLGAPPRMARILEGEALVNDGTALVVYKLALGAVVSGTFSLPGGILEFVAVAIGGAAIGVVVGWVSARIRSSFDEAPIEITISLLTPFAAYIPAERLGVSGVLAVAAAGLYLGHQSGAIFSAETRLHYYSFWEVLSFLLTSILFLLIGLELRSVLDGLGPGELPTLVAQAALVSAVVLGIRLAWVFTVAPLIDRLPGPPLARSPRERLALGWSGMRGGISLAAALAIPLTAAGGPFPSRGDLIFIAFVVIVVTLILPGLTLPWLIERLGLGTDDAHARLDAGARAHVARAALARLDDLAAADASADAVMQARVVYERRLQQSEAVLGGSAGVPDLDSYGRVRRELVAAERAALAELRRGRLPDEIVRNIERDLDLEETRLRRQDGGSARGSTI